MPGTSGIATTTMLRMLGNPHFHGDEDGELIHAQICGYAGYNTVLFETAKRRYLAAATLIGVETKLSRRLRISQEFDHRSTQEAYNLVAAYFRFEHGESRQMEFGETEQQYRDRLLQVWVAFFELEVERLVEDDQLTRAICTAGVYSNTDEGAAARKEIKRLLSERHSAAGSMYCR